MGAFDEVQNVEDLFNKLDENNYSDIAKPLAALRRSLMNEGFTRREAMRLVESYSRFIYDISLEEFLSDTREEEIDHTEDLATEETDFFDDDGDNIGP